MNLTTVAVPNLIAHDLVIVHPMSSMSGYITYIEYQYASNKGQTKQGDPIANPFGLYTDREGTKTGNVDTDFTSSRVVETLDTQGATVDHAFAWTPSLGSVEAKIDGVWTPVAEELLVKDDKGVITGINKTSFADGTQIKYVYDNVVIPQNDLPMIKAEMKSIALVAKARRIAVYYSQIAA